MYSTLLDLHSYIAYIVFSILILAVINSLMGYFGNKDYTLAKDFRIGLFTLIFTHIQVTLGFVLYFVSPNGFNAIQTNGMGGLSAFARLLAVEHPFVNILAVVLITIGWVKHKKEETDKRKFGKIAVFFTIGLVLLLSRLPWAQWL